MYPPQPPGQPPGGPGFPPPPPPPPPGPYGGPGYPPPPRNGGGALVPVLIISVVAVLAVVGVGAFLVVGSDDDDGDDRTSAITSSTPYTPETSSTPYSPAPTPTRSVEGTSADPSKILSTTIRTAKGHTFTRAGTRTASCTSRANTKLRTALRSHPCTESMHSAVYADPSKRIITSVSVLTFSTQSAASTVSKLTPTKAWPKLLTPSDASGLRQPRPDPAYWTRSWWQGPHVIYAQSYWSTGADAGSRSGSVFATAGELGVEITNTLVWSN